MTDKVRKWQPGRIINHCDDCHEVEYNRCKVGDYYSAIIPNDCLLNDYKEPQWVGKPDSEGWWWLLWEGEEPGIEYVDNPSDWVNPDLVTKMPKEMHFKVCKAILPELPKEIQHDS